jgi:glyoxylase-like metal-dependent hydrolase (beta-lactamase superfamily II)
VRVRLLHTPGHTPGSQCFLVESAGTPGTLVSGDTLFLGSCGRVDLPGSDPEAMYRSLNTTLKQLPDETLLYPGHLYSADPSSTMGEQKRRNPFLRVTTLEQFLGFVGG